MPRISTVTALEKSIETWFAMITVVEALQTCKPVRAGVCGRLSKAHDYHYVGEACRVLFANNKCASNQDPAACFKCTS